MGKKIFSIHTLNSSTFSLSIFGASILDTLRVFLRIPIRIVAILTTYTKFAIGITIKSMSLIASKVNLIVNMQQPVYTGKVRFSLTPKEIGKISPSFDSSLTISAILRAREKMLLSFATGSLNIDFAVQVGVFYTLATYDPDALLDWDGVTLGTMDFTSA